MTRQVLRTPIETFAVVRPIGEGGAGRVVEVEGNEGRKFAAKILKAGAPTNQKKRFRNELFFCLRQSHANVIRVLDYGETTELGETTPFVVMPLYESSLRRRMEAGLDAERALKIFEGVLQGVESAHLRGIWHRDLKPENILVGALADEVVVSDFGVAHFSEEDLATAVETRAQERLANFRYAAPEQRLRGGQVDHRVDLFALGLILNELFTRETAQGAGYRKIADVAPEWGALDELVEALIQQAPGRRPADLAEVKREFGRLTGLAAARQVLDRERNEVVSIEEADHPTAVGESRVDWDLDQLSVHLDRQLDPEWIRVFKEGRYSHGELGGIGPEHASVSMTGSIVVPATEGNAASMLNLVRAWIEGTNQELSKIARAREKERARQAELEKARRIREMAARARVLASLGASAKKMDGT